MKENKTNKVLIGVIIALTVVIVALAAVFLVTVINIKNDTDNSNTKKTSNQVTTPMTTVQETTTAVPTTAEPTTKAITCKKGIYKRSEQKNSDIMMEGGCYLDVKKISKNKISFEYWVIQSPPANRLASIYIDDLELTDGKAHFTFEDDGWYNRGEGDIQILSEKKIKISTEITRLASSSMWSLGSSENVLIYSGKSE